MQQAARVKSPRFVVCRKKAKLAGPLALPALDKPKTQNPETQASGEGRMEKGGPDVVVNRLVKEATSPS